MSFARSLKSEFQEVDSDEMDMSFEMSSDSLSMKSPVSCLVPRKLTFTNSPSPSSPSSKTRYSPPYKRIGFLRLFDRPLTPKTILEKSSVCTMTIPKVRLFSPTDKPLAVPSAYAKNDKPAANVNPFTPSSMLLSKKRTRSTRSLLGSPDCSISKGDLDSDVSDVENEQPTKRVALQESNITRYHQEFHELALIGIGQFGSVYKCINRLDGCTYAIKKSTRPVAGSSLEKTALNEVYAHAVLGSYQHVVRYYSAWAEDNHMIIQNEYCNGGALSDKISQEALSVSELSRLLLHMAKGLRYIHSLGLVHLDLKPANVFISWEKNIQYTNYDSADDGFEDLEEHSQHEDELTYKIGDLGHVTSINDPQVEEGDCRYLPVEILQEDYSHLPKADIFAFGLTVLEAAGCGPLPKNGDKWHKIRSGELPPLPQNLHQDLLELLQSMIHQDPAERPTAVQILHHRSLSLVGNKSKAQLHRELNAERLKTEILSKQLVEFAKCIKTIETKSTTRLSARLIGKKYNRSFSTTTF